MIPLTTSQQVMTWLSMCPANESTSKKSQIYHAVFTLIVGMIICAALLTSLSFIIKNHSTDLESCLYAVFQVAGHSAMLNLLIVGLISRHRIAAIFTELTKLYTANKSEISFGFLTKANNKSEWLWNIYFLGMKGTFVNMFISTIASIMYKYGAFNAEHLYKPYKLLLPWNQHTLCGYIGEIVFTIATGESYFIMNGAVLILFISLSWHHQAFWKRFRSSALKLDQLENVTSANETLSDLLRFHITVKDWFLQTAEVYSPFVLIQLICNVILMSTVLYELDLRINRMDFEIFLLLNAVSIGVWNLYMYCYFGQLATESYEKMAECLYESNWHELPLDLQKKCLFMIKNMQKPVVYHGFGVALLNLQAFIKVIREIYTYYMIFKTLTSK